VQIYSPRENSRTATYVLTDVFCLDSPNPARPSFSPQPVLSTPQVTFTTTKNVLVQLLVNNHLVGREPVVLVTKQGVEVFSGGKAVPPYA
jgi:hypothetical protein